MSALDSNTALFAYELCYSDRRRSVGLTIKGGVLTVRAPTGYPIEKISALLNKKQSWITRHLQRTITALPVDWLALRELPYLTEQLALVQQIGRVSSVLRQQNQLLLTLSSKVSSERQLLVAQKLLRQWYKQQAEQWFSKRVLYWQQQMGLTAKNIVIGNWRTKWGYCKNNRELGFNWRLLMAPDWVADYVVVHELAHLQHLNHSTAFWQLVTQYFPQAEEAKHWLKQYQHRMEL